MNCPSHCLIFGHRKRSYRELPIRYADFGRLHRAERSGTLHGLTRVRSFAQDDAHIFCMPEQIGDEISASAAHDRRGLHATSASTSGDVLLSTRPEKSIGSDEMWERAEGGAAPMPCAAPASRTRSTPATAPSTGRRSTSSSLDALKRAWQLATVQLDFGALPERFDLTYVRPDGSEARPVMIHRAVLGTIERFMGILIEHCAGAFPLWLAPDAGAGAHPDRAPAGVRRARSAGALRAAGFRAELDDRNEKLGYKIREAQLAKVPYMLVVGDKEAADRTVAPRSRSGGSSEPVALDAIHRRAARRSEPRAAPSDEHPRGEDHAQDQDQPRRRQALQGDRHRQDHAQQGVSAPPADLQDAQAEAPPAQARRWSTPPTRRAIRKLIPYL